MKTIQSRRGSSALMKTTSKSQRAIVKSWKPSNPQGGLLHFCKENIQIPKSVCKIMKAIQTEGLFYTLVKNIQIPKMLFWDMSIVWALAWKHLISFLIPFLDSNIDVWTSEPPETFWNAWGLHFEIISAPFRDHFGCQSRLEVAGITLTPFREWFWESPGTLDPTTKVLVGGVFQNRRSTFFDPLEAPKQTSKREVIPKRGPQWTQGSPKVAPRMRLNNG